jgi:type II restriction enzyme
MFLVESRPGMDGETSTPLQRLCLRLTRGSLFVPPRRESSPLLHALIHEFAPRFASNTLLVEMHDSDGKTIYRDIAYLERLGVGFPLRVAPPDMILHNPAKNWLMLIVLGDGGKLMDHVRLRDLRDGLKNCKAGKVFVSAFLSQQEFTDVSKRLPSETEVWAADNPDHLLHFNGTALVEPPRARGQAPVN